MCICQYQSPNLSLPPLPPGNHVCSLHLWLYFYFVNRFICTIFLDSTYKRYHMVFVFLWLISLSMTISRSIPVAANGIILFFLWLSNIPLYICTTSSLSIPLLIRLLPCPAVVNRNYTNFLREDLNKGIGERAKRKCWGCPEINN